jgi:hypothetical protein
MKAVPAIVMIESVQNVPTPPTCSSSARKNDVTAKLPSQFTICEVHCAVCSV